METADHELRRRCCVRAISPLTPTTTGFGVVAAVVPPAAVSAWLPIATRDQSTSKTIANGRVSENDCLRKCTLAGP